MKTIRRDFIKLGLLQAIALGASQATNAKGSKVKRRNGPSILQGATDETNTQFNILTDDYSFEVQVTNDRGEIWLPDDVKKISFTKHPKVITKVFFSKLRSNENYYLILKDSENKEIIDTRTFTTLDINKADLRFAICSCMKDTEHDSAIWRNMVKNEPDILFFIGDAVYVDHDVPKGGVTPAHLWRRFCEARNTLDIYYSKKLIPIFATWDDHDFGINDGNSLSFPYVKESQMNFLSFFSQDPSHCQLLQKGPGVSNALTIKNHLFILLDDRSFRHGRGSNDRYAHWGKEQEEWFIGLINNHAGTTWLMNGSQFFPVVPWKESVAGEHKNQFSALIDQLKSASSRTVFISGDVHFSEISRIEPAMLGYETYELTSSSIHSKNIPGVPDIFKNPRRIAGTAKRNYIMVESKLDEQNAPFRAISYSFDNQIMFRMNLKV
ncbi:MAG: alkaline phosphatase D family protein [Bdellovibrio sp.]